MQYCNDVREERLVAQRDQLIVECEPHPEFRTELAKHPLETQVKALAFVVGIRKSRPTRH